MDLLGQIPENSSKMADGRLLTYAVHGGLIPVGTKSEMLAVENSYLKGDFTPFKDPNTVEVSSSKSSSAEGCTEEPPQAASSSKQKRRKRSTNAVLCN